MTQPITRNRVTRFWVFWAIWSLSAGCASVPSRTEQGIVPASAPKELNKVSLPTYVIEPPDILLVDVIRAVPKEYKIAALDSLVIQASGVLPTDPIAGIFSVD